MALIGSVIINLGEVDSTNRYLLDWLTKERPAEGTLVNALNQTAGRGLDGTVWESAPSLNLTFSFILYPDFLSPDSQFYLNKAISLGLADAVHEIMPARMDIRIKWPNDIYIGNKKLAGTLIQNGVKGSGFDYSVIGIGININQDKFTDGPANPISLKMASGFEYERDEVFSKIIACLNHRYNGLKSGSRNILDENYRNLLFRYGEVSDYVYKGKSVRAKITGVNRYGQLILEIPGEKVIECDLKEIAFQI